MNRYADCTYCGGEVVEQTIDYDYRRQKHLMVVSNVPAGVCRQCGEKYFKPDILKRRDSVYPGIFERHEKPQRTLTIPAVLTLKQSRNRSAINKCCSFRHFENSRNVEVPCS